MAGRAEPALRDSGRGVAAFPAPRRHAHRRRLDTRAARTARRTRSAGCGVVAGKRPSGVAGHVHRARGGDNVCKHASARAARSRRRATRSANFEVDDDGDGMPETLAADGGIGLRVMRHCAKPPLEVSFALVNSLAQNLLVV